MNKKSLKTIFTLTAAIMLAYTPVSLTAPAYAYDDDIDVVCTENDAGETICESVDDLKAECPLSDPDGEGELCGGLNESRPTRGLLGGFGAFRR